MLNSNLHQEHESDMQSCKMCKKPFATKEAMLQNLKFIKKAQYLDICPTCRKNIAIENSTKYLKRK